MKHILLLATGLILLATATAQDSATSKRSYFQAGLDFQSNNVYMGRADSTRLPYLSPTFSYYHKSGFYTTAGLSYLAASGASRIDLFTLGAGYSFSVKNFEAQTSLTKYFYNSQSANIRSSVSVGVRADMQYDIAHALNVLGGAGVDFGTYTDMSALLGLSHDFHFAADKFEVSPAFSFNAGSQNFYKAYQAKKQNAALRRKNNKQVIVVDVADAKAFRLLDYEASVPVSYSTGAFSFNAAVNAAFPVNPAVITITVPATGNHRTVQESVSTHFFWTAGLTWSFY